MHLPCILQYVEEQAKDPDWCEEHRLEEIDFHNVVNNAYTYFDQKVQKVLTENDLDTTSAHIMSPKLFAGQIVRYIWKFIPDYDLKNKPNVIRGLSKYSVFMVAYQLCVINPDRYNKPISKYSLKFGDGVINMSNQNGTLMCSMELESLSDFVLIQNSIESNIDKHALKLIQDRIGECVDPRTLDKIDKFLVELDL